MAATISAPPSWSLRAGIFASGCLAFSELYSTQGILPAIAMDLGGSPAGAAITIAATTAAVALGSLLLGLMSWHWDRRRSIAAAGFMLSAIAAVSAFSPSLVTLVVARAAEGFLIPIVFTAAIALASQQTAAGRLVGWYMSGVAAGSFLSRFIAGIGAQWRGWRYGLAADAALALLLTIAVLLLLPRNDAPARNADPPRIPANLASLPLVRLYGIGWAALFISVGAFTFLSLRLAGTPFNLSVAPIASISAVFLASSLTMPVVGRLYDRYGSAFVLRLSQLIGASGVVLTLSRDLVLNVVGLTLISFGVFAVQTAANTRVATLAGNRRQQATAFYLSSYYLGGTCAALSLTGIWSTFGWTGCTIVFLILQSVIALSAV